MTPTIDANAEDPASFSEDECPQCHGSGSFPRYTRQVCESCHGTGRAYVAHAHEDGTLHAEPEEER